MRKQNLFAAPSIGQLNEDEIKALKAEYPGGIFAIKTITGKIAYFRNPSLDDLNIATSQVDPDVPLDFAKNLMTDCFVGGCEDLVKDKDDFLGASRQFTKKIDGTKSELVEL